MRCFLFAGITLLAAGCQAQDLGGSSEEPCSVDSDQCSPGDVGGAGAGGAGGGAGGSGGIGGWGSSGGMGGSGGSGGMGGAEPPGCGNGKIEPGETCDDGNTLDGDGCPGVCFHAANNLDLGGASTCAILLDERLKCWGMNSTGQLGLGDNLDRGDSLNEMGDFLPAVDLGAGQSADSVSIGIWHACALLKGGKVKCWGQSSLGQLGLGHTKTLGDDAAEMGDNLPAVDLGLGQIPVAISAAAEHTCALLQGGSVKCWGQNSFGRLGLGDTQIRGDNLGEMGDNLPAVDLGAGKVVVALALGAFHTCALLSDQTVKCWGDNSFGTLGLGDGQPRGDQPGEMGDNLPAVELGEGAVAIAAGSWHTCALLAGGSVKCWGRNNNGQLGLGDNVNRGDNPGEMGDNLPAVDLGQGKIAASIAVGGQFNCALLNDGSVKCWGYNGTGALGIGTTDNGGDAPGEMGDNLPAVDLGAGPAPSSIIAGATHACARFMDGRFKCWGTGTNGRTGYESELDKGDEPAEMGDNLPFVKL